MYVFILYIEPKRNAFRINYETSDKIQARSKKHKERSRRGRWEVGGTRAKTERQKKRKNNNRQAEIQNKKLVYNFFPHLLAVYFFFECVFVCVLDKQVFEISKCGRPGTGPP